MNAGTQRGIGPWLYALAFCVLLPSAMVAWATFAQASPPGVRAPVVGWVIGAAGLALIAWAMIELRVKSGGLPMNAYPPMRRVESGPFAAVDHPIYVGFVLACAGVAVATGSGAGLWVVTPAAALGIAALVLGYERRATLERLGPRRTPAFLSLAPATDAPPTIGQRAACMLMIFLPWLVLYEAIGHLPTPGAIDPRLAWEVDAPVWVWTEAVYALVYPLTVLAPWLTRSSADLRRFQVTSIAAMALGFWFYLAVPVVSPPRAFDETAPLGWLLALERADGLEGRAALPSFHVYWAFASAWVLARRWRRLAWIFWAAALAISVSCVTTGMHAAVDVVAGVLLFVLSHQWRAVWGALVRGGEAIANTWAEWRIGPVRVLVHAVYAALAAGAGVLIAGSLVDASVLPWLAAVALGGLVGAAAWGQWLEGGGRLSRPFGYFGYILGAGAVLCAAPLWLGERAWLLGAALATGAGIAQALGRLRCLVQGCCHGGPAAHGIRYADERSRVAAIAGWRGRPLTPTPVVSMLAGVAIFGLTARLWSAEVPASMIVGLYLLLTGLARFVEEHYRGEPQTRTLWGLRSYQWTSIASVAVGAAVMCVPSPVADVAGSLTGGVWVWAGVIAAVHAAAMGVDFPGSSRRFSRLVPGRSQNTENTECKA